MEIILAQKIQELAMEKMIQPMPRYIEYGKVEVRVGIQLNKNQPLNVLIQKEIYLQDQVLQQEVFKEQLVR